MKRVVVTGIGALTTIGNNAHDFWENLKNGVSGAGNITKFDASKFKTRFACEVKGFNVLDHIDKGEARRYDPFTQYALVAVDEAVRHANIDFEKLNKIMT